MIELGLSGFAAIVLAGGQASRLGGVDKASIELGGRSLLERALDAVVDAGEVVVVGEQVPTERPATFVLEDPRHGGPAAGLLTGRDSLLRRFPTLAVLAVDMPHLTSWTVRRLQEAAVGHEGAVLTGPDGRSQLAFVVETARLDAVRPGREEQHGLAIRTLLEPLDMVAVPSVGDEARDVDTWTDLRDLASEAERRWVPPQAAADAPETLVRCGSKDHSGRVNLHDWIDELCDVLDIDAEADEGLLVDLAGITRDNVHPAAGPVTAFLLGFAAGEQGADPDGVEKLAARAQGLAEAWDRPAGAPAVEDEDVEIDELTDPTYEDVDSLA